MSEENGVYRSVMRERRNQRRKQLGVGLAGLAAIAGAGAFVAQSQLVDLARTTSTREPYALGPPALLSPSPSVSGARSRAVTPVPGRLLRSAARQETSPTPTPSPSPSTSASASPGVVAAALVKRHSETTRQATIRVTSARFDLTGQPELAVVGDDGWVMGRARCTKTLRSAPGQPPKAVPSMLVCWRTSPSRSVVTVAVAAKGRPSAGESVAALEREWERLSRSP
ncbi:hypothetical protein [Actinoplanes sp. URMC 104]|uniref:hypothetical protein n=1 Tax=Actinoplanes sp. URMC 104 TaxID=3423409 RepID=UPI003F1CC02E